MGTITAQAITDRSWKVLQDSYGAGGTRWTGPEMLDWINDGQREVVMYLPSAYTQVTKVAPAAGTRQTLASLSLTTGLQPLRVTRNFDSAGTTPGRAITKVSMAVMDQERPDWHGDTAAEAVHFMTDPADPKAFYLYPAITGTGKIELVYSASPADVAAIGDAIVLDDIYANALHYYQLFKALSKRVQGNVDTTGQAGSYYNLFLQALGQKGKVELAADRAQTAAGMEG